MRTFPDRFVFVLTSALLPMAAVLRLSACSTPVCHYALQNWPADTYEILVSCQAADVAALKATCEGALGGAGGAGANATLRFRETAAEPALTPQVEVRFPDHRAGRPPFWTGALSPERLQGITDSPVRSQLVGELLGGAAAVFLFLPAGDLAVDPAARARLRAALDEMARTLSAAPSAGDVPGAAPAPAFRFPIVEVPPQDPAEGFLRAMLLASEADLAELHEPMAFPVFGRGRALYALVGAGINRDTLAEACSFMTGACSCEVKAQNPGTDLLLRADWKPGAGLTDPTFIELPPLTGLSAAEPDRLPAVVRFPPTAPSVPPSSPARHGLNGRVLRVVALAVLAVLAATLAVLAVSRRC